MRLTRLPMKFSACALSLALGAAVLAMPAPARAADDGVPLDSKILRGILEGLGLRKDGEAIDYQERAPLVIPPNRALPPPEKSDAVVANNPAWPKDPDVAKRKLEAAQEKIPRSSQDMENDARPLMPDQLTPGRNARNVSRRVEKVQGSEPGNGDRLMPSELGYKGGLFSGMFGKKDEETAKFTGEAPRASLIDPPAGYRTPSPDQPYGLTADKSPPKAYDYKTKHGTEDN